MWQSSRSHFTKKTNFTGLYGSTIFVNRVSEATLLFRHFLLSALSSHLKVASHQLKELLARKCVIVSKQGSLPCLTHRITGCSVLVSGPIRSQLFPLSVVVR